MPTQQQDRIEWYLEQIWRHRLGGGSCFFPGGTELRRLAGGKPKYIQKEEVDIQYAGDSGCVYCGKTIPKGALRGKGQVTKAIYCLSHLIKERVRATRRK